jgi:hypothetical protein
MKVAPLRLAFVLAAATGTLFSFVQGDFGILRLIAAAVVVIIAVIGPETDDTLIFLLAAGEVLVIAVATASFLIGVLVQCAVIGAALSDDRVMPDRRDRNLFLLLCGAVLGGALVLERANQPLLPFVVMVAAGIAATFVITGVQEMRERRRYREEVP